MGLSGLSGMSGLSGIAGGESYVVLPGHTLYYRDLLDGTRQNGSLGSPALWSAITAGTLYGGLNRGSLGLDANGDPVTSRTSGGVQWYDAFSDATTAKFRGYRSLTASGTFCRFIEGYFRFIPGSATTRSKFMTLHSNSAAIETGTDYTVGSFGGLRGLQIDVNSTTADKVYVSGGSITSPADATSDALDINTWIKIRLGFQVRVSGGNGIWTWMGGYKPSGGVFTPFWKKSFSVATATWQVTGTNNLKLALEALHRQNQGCPIFIASMLSIYAFDTPMAENDTLDDGSGSEVFLDSTDYGEPAEEVKSFEIDGATGNDATLLGPWETFAGVNTAYKRHVFQAPSNGIYWRTAAGASANYSTIASANAADAVRQAYGSDSTAYTTAGDTLTVYPGLYELGSTDEQMFYKVDGLKIVASDLEDKPVISLNPIFTPGTWTDAGDHYSAANAVTARCGVAQVHDGLWYPLRCVRLINTARAEAILDAQPGTYCTEGGVLKVHPFDLGPGEDANDYQWAVWSGVGDGGNGAFQVGNNLLRGIKFKGGHAYGVDATGTADDNPTVKSTEIVRQLAVKLDSYFTIIDRCEFSHSGDHATILTGVAAGVVLFVDCVYSHAQPGPPSGASGDELFMGYNNGDHYAIVDYVDEAGSTHSTLLTSYYLRCDNTLNRGIVGESAADTDGALVTYISHQGDSGGTNHYDRTTLDSCTFIGSPLYGTEHVEFEVTP